MYNLKDLLHNERHRDRLAQQIDQLDAEPASYLRSLKIKIISTCNLRCEMCKYWRIAKQQLPKDVIIPVLDSAASLGCQKVHLSGGEVTLHPHLNVVIAHAAGLGMRVNLTSNGLAVNKERAHAWIGAGLRSASFSLDGVRAKTHDQIRGVSGAFKRTLRAIRLLARERDRRQAKLKIRINTVVSKRNLGELPDLIRLAGELGAVDVVPMPIDGMPDLLPSAVQIQDFNERIVPLTYELRVRYGMPTTPGRLYPLGRTLEQRQLAAQGRYGFGYYEQHLCYAPWLHTFVSHTGEVFACCMTREKMPALGNVFQQSLVEIFQGTAYRQFRRQMRRERLTVCANCDQYLAENRLVASRLAETQLPFGLGGPACSVLGVKSDGCI